MKNTSKSTSPLSTQDTHVYIDVSNIRSACLKTLGFKVDFVKLLGYFQQKYPNLREVRYYEGIATDDTKKRQMFDFLSEKGYTICPLERKSYISTEVEWREVKCPACGNQWTAQFTKEHKAMKSNVDVYLATEMLTVAHKVDRPTHIILVSCDGDYAEMIRNALENENVSVSVLATPLVRGRNNTLSKRLHILRGRLPRFMIRNIGNIRHWIQ